METLEESSLDFYAMLRSVVDQKRQAELREALETSAFTAPPAPPDPNAIEPVTALVSSPAWSEKPAPLTTTKPKVAAEPQSKVTVGVPTVAE
jgi:phospholipid-binding lipoprotein MlaA